MSEHRRSVRHLLRRVGVTQNRLRYLLGVTWDTAVMCLVPMVVVNGVRFVRKEEIQAGVLLMPSRETIAADQTQVLVAAFIAVMVLWQSGMYRRIWRFATWNDLERLLLAAIGAGALAAAATYSPLRQPWQTIGLATLMIGIVAVAIAMPRVVRTVLARRAIAMAGQRRRRSEREQLAQRTGHATRVANTDAVALPVSLRPRVLIIGAGPEGRQLAQALLEQARPDSPLPVGFLDDNRSLSGALLHGLPVLGAVSEMAWHARSMQVIEVLIAVPDVDGDTLRRYFDTAQSAGLVVRTVPSLAERVGLREAPKQPVRDLRIEDLLRRDPRTPDYEGMRALVGDRHVLVTGAGGSIGSELCRQLAQAGAKRIVLMGRGENSIFEIERDLATRDIRLEIVPIICDVRDGNALARVLAKWRPEVVFHAAAHKHVPYMEEHPVEALMVNVIGTWRLATACADIGIERFVLISSDKAVTANNIMGASKRIAELIVRGMAQRLGVPWSVVRFGNVLGSRGSVVPTFLAQIERGGPVTITDRRMQRYFMTIPEAATLVLESAVIAKEPGELFMLDMGDPVPVMRIAEDLIRLAGYVPGDDIDIVETGIRPGEVLEERLIRDEEQLVSSSRPAIFKVVSSDTDEVDRLLQQLPMVAAEVMRGMSDDAARVWLRRLAPERRAAARVPTPALLVS